MSRNVIKEYVDFNKKNLKNYTKRIMGKYYDEELFMKYLNVYVNVRYYNQEMWVRKDFNNHITYYLDKVYDKNVSDKSKFILGLFKFYYYIDDVLDFDFDKNMDKFLDVVDRFRVSKLNLKDKSFKNEFRQLLVNNENKKNRFLTLYDSEDFNLEINKIYDDIYNIEIDHNITIPKIFSSYAINKVWDSKMISENKLQIEYYLISIVILRDIISGKFSKKYISELSVSLFDKLEKLKRTFRILDNDIAKDLVIIKIKYNSFVKNKDTVLNYIKEGFQFAVVLDNSYLENKKNKPMLDIFKYIIVNNKKYINDDIKGRDNVINLR